MANNIFKYTDKDWNDMWYGYVLPATICNCIILLYVIVAGVK